MTPNSLDDFEAAARRLLPRSVFAFLDGGADGETTRRRNRAVWDGIGLIPSVLTGRETRAIDRALWGRRHAAPFGIAPMGGLTLAAFRADRVLADAAEAAGLPMMLSGAALTAMETVGRGRADIWFQAYLPGDAAAIDRLLTRVGAAGFETLCVTVDVPVKGHAEAARRAGFGLPVRPTPRLIADALAHPRWLMGCLARGWIADGPPRFENYESRRPVLGGAAAPDGNLTGRGALGWTHLDRIRAVWPGRLVVKGILAPDDARRAERAGADGIVLSNHGGRQLDGAVHPLDVLEEIVAARQGPMAVMLDGGVRRGTDVVKALALGADFVFLGRPMIYAATVGGRAGVDRAIALLTAEIDRAMALLGVADLDALGPRHVKRL